VEYPDDPGSWLIEDEYMFGSDMLVAPLFKDSIYNREVYLPPGKWIDYQSGKIYEGGWHPIAAGNIPAIILIKDGSVIPLVKLAQSTKYIDWSNIELVVYATGKSAANGEVYLPNDNMLHQITIKKKNGYSLTNDPYAGKVKWVIHSYKNKK
jgi:alpha-D-xyloside xylohydrolase